MHNYSAWVISKNVHCTDYTIIIAESFPFCVTCPFLGWSSSIIIFVWPLDFSFWLLSYWLSPFFCGKISVMLRPAHTKRKRTRKRKISLMFAAYFFDLFRLFFDLFCFHIRFRSVWTGLYNGYFSYSCHKFKLHWRGRITSNYSPYGFPIRECALLYQALLKCLCTK